MLLLVRNPRSSCSLIDFVNQMKKGGLYVLGQVTLGSLKDSPQDPLAEKTQDWLSLIDHLKVKAFVELTMADTIRSGVEQLVRVAGIGAMKPNTVLMGFHETDIRHLDDLSTPGSPFFNPEFDGLLENDDSEVRLTPEDYVGIIEDTLKQQKNICLCRNFQSLDRAEVFSSDLKFRTRAGRKKYLDVWPVNFLTSEETCVTDNTSLFMFQLSCIVNMVSKWRSHKLRVFMCVRAADSNIASKEKELQRLLEVLRIKAETHVLVWDHLASMLEAGPGEASSQHQAPRGKKYGNKTCQNKKRSDLGPQNTRIKSFIDLGLTICISVSEEYLTAVNEFIRVKCSETAVSFIYLPPPPAGPPGSYVSHMEAITRNLPPTILVNGVSPVITTTL